MSCPSTRWSHHGQSMIHQCDPPRQPFNCVIIAANGADSRSADSLEMCAASKDFTILLPPRRGTIFRNCRSMFWPSSFTVKTTRCVMTDHSSRRVVCAQCQRPFYANRSNAKDLFEYHCGNATGQSKNGMLHQCRNGKHAMRHWSES